MDYQWVTGVITYRNPNYKGWAHLVGVATFPFYCGAVGPVLYQLHSATGLRWANEAFGRNRSGDTYHLEQPGRVVRYTQIDCSLNAWKIARCILYSGTTKLYQKIRNKELFFPLSNWEICGKRSRCKCQCMFSVKKYREEHWGWEI